MVALCRRLRISSPTNPSRLGGATRDPATIRARVTRVLEQARAAERPPWPDQEARMWRTVFPQMADWLPKSEADALRAAFTHEMTRLAGS